MASIKVKGIPSLTLVSKAMSAADKSRDIASLTDQMDVLVKAMLTDQGTDRIPLWTVADQNEPCVRVSPDDMLEGPDRRGMIFQRVEPRDQGDDQVVSAQPQLLPDRLAVVWPFESRDVDPVVNHRHALDRDALVDDEGLANRFAHSHDTVPTLEEKTIGDDPLGSRVVGKPSTMLGEQHRRTTPEEPGRDSVEERRVLVRMHKINLFLAEQLGHPSRTTPIQPALTTQHMHGKPIAEQVLTQRSELVQTDKDKAIQADELTSQPGCQNLCSTDVQSMQDLTDHLLCHVRSTVESMKPSGR